MSLDDFLRLLVADQKTRQSRVVVEVKGLVNLRPPEVAVDKRDAQTLTSQSSRDVHRGCRSSFVPLPLATTNVCISNSCPTVVTIVAAALNLSRHLFRGSWSIR